MVCFIREPARVWLNALEKKMREVACGVIGVLVSNCDLCKKSKQR